MPPNSHTLPSKPKLTSIILQIVPITKLYLKHTFNNNKVIFVLQILVSIVVSVLYFVTFKCNLLMNYLSIE